jgi:hypothetical protein
LSLRAIFAKQSHTLPWKGIASSQGALLAMTAV